MRWIYCQNGNNFLQRTKDFADVFLTSPAIADKVYIIEYLRKCCLVLVGGQQWRVQMDDKTIYYNDEIEIDLLRLIGAVVNKAWLWDWWL